MHEYEHTNPCVVVFEHSWQISGHKPSLLPHISRLIRYSGLVSIEDM